MALGYTQIAKDFEEAAKAKELAEEKEKAKAEKAEPTKTSIGDEDDAA
jgi:hypothetical protein